MELRHYAEKQRAFSNEQLVAQDTLSQLEKAKVHHQEQLAKFKYGVQQLAHLSAAECVKTLANTRSLAGQRLGIPLSQAAELNVNHAAESEHQTELNQALQNNADTVMALTECTQLIEQYDQAIASEQLIFNDKQAAKKRAMKKFIKVTLWVVVIAVALLFALAANKNLGVHG